MLVPDFSQATKFLCALDESMEFTFQIYDDTKRSRRAEHFSANFSDDQIQQYLSAANAAGCGVFYMANAGDGQGRSNVNVTALRELVVDLDGAPLDPVMRCGIDPHFIIESSPGRYQCHWIINAVPITSFESRDEARHKFATWQVAIARKFGGDESVKDLSRVFRIPGFWHQKGQPFQTRILESSGARNYDLEEIVAALQLDSIITRVSSEIKTALSDVDTLINKKISTGNRHRVLLAYASKYAHQYRLGYNERKWLLNGLNKWACEKPIDERDIERINIQAGKYAEEERAKVEAVDITALLNRHTITQDNTFPKDLLRPSGMVGDTVDNILASSIKPQPELALAAALVACGTVMGRKVRSPSNLRTNLYALFLAETGGGKDWPRQAIKRIFAEVGCEKRAAIEDVASDAAISEAVHSTPSQLLLMDEFGLFMKNVTSKQAGTHLSAIPALLMKLHSSAGGIYYSKAYADQKNNHVIHSPNVGLLATSVERNFYKAITKENCDDGLLNRILFFKTSDPDPIMRPVEAFDPPVSLIEQYAAWESLPYRYDGGNLDTVEAGEMVKPSPRIVPYGDGAEAVFLDMERDLRALRRSLRQEGLSGLYTRVFENSIKVALVIAAGDNIECPVIEVRHAEYACRLVQYLTGELMKAVKRDVSDSRIEAQHKAVLSLIRGAGIDGITKKDLGQRCKDFGLKRSEREEIIKELVEWGQVVPKEIQGLTKPTVRYILVEDK